MKVPHVYRNRQDPADFGRFPTKETLNSWNRQDLAELVSKAGSHPVTRWITNGERETISPYLYKCTNITTQHFLRRATLDDEYDFTPFESQGSGEAVRLDEFEVPR